MPIAIKSDQCLVCGKSNKTFLGMLPEECLFFVFRRETKISVVITTRFTNWLFWIFHKKIITDLKCSILQNKNKNFIL